MTFSTDLVKGQLPDPIILKEANIKLPKDPKRISKTINENWTFNYFPKKDADKAGYEQPGFNDAKWSVVAVPHTWMTYETTGELHPYVKNASPKDSPYWWDGWGIYRKKIVIGKEFADKKLFVEFDAVQKYSKVWLNGKYLGDHKGGYGGFYFDITDAVKFGEENLLVVAANNTMDDKYSIPPMSAGNFDVYGGINRDVRIVIKDKLHIPYQGSYKHEGGTFVTTPVVNQKEGVVNVLTYVKNDYKEDKNVKLVTIITDADNKEIDRMEVSKILSTDKIHQFSQKSKTINKPNLWSPETPYVYNVHTELYLDNKLVDTYYSPLGFRWFKWDYTKNKLHLNGKEVHVHGQNRHEEYVWLGGAFPKWIAMRDMKDIRYGLEHNFMRTAHYSHDASIYHFTDRNGIFINEELPNIKNQVFNQEVQEQNLREMIRRDRNHPSIFFWSMGNETTDAADSKWAVEEDTTRIVTSRHVYNDSAGEFNPHTEKNMSIEGFLRCTIKGWYSKDERDLEPTDGQHAGTEENDVKRALEKNVQSHYGSVWLYADHGADREYVNSPLKHINPKGWVDSWRNPKYKYYLWQANFATKPMVFIQYHYWRKQYIGQKKNFMIHSNCDVVELFVNGKSKGKKNLNAANQFTTTFNDILVEKGIIEAVGTKKDGTKVSYKIEMADDAKKIVLEASHTKQFAGRDGVIEIRAKAFDKNGVQVIGARPTLKWTVKGPATLVGPESYTSDIHKVEESEGTMYIDLPVTNLIRSTGEPGKVEITVSTSDLETGKVEVEFVAKDKSDVVKGIEEPVLSLQGREAIPHNMTQVSRIIAPQEMKYFTGELQYPMDKIKPSVTAFIKKENPTISTTTLEFNYVIAIFTQMMQANNGRLVADDYNFTVDQYNISREITRFIDKQDFPQAYKDELKDYYAYNIVFKGRDKNFIYQKDLIAKIPTGGKSVILNAKQKKYKDVIYTSETDLKKLVHQVYPETAKLEDGEMETILNFIVNVNPYVSSSRTRDRKTKIYTYTYSIDADKAILLPDPAKIQKIKKFPSKEF
ncbi:glycoside hydrolase family 2 protein [Pseudopedobacter saltans]|nr:glycoside hydrolase family 2 TIM barrel-domain containing protein [Pseudopedobacter saltans]